MVALLIRWLVVTVAVVIAANIVPGFRVASTGTAFLAAMVLSLLNAVVRPLLFVLTLPVNILTLGLFTFVLNGVMVWMTAGLLRGVSVNGLGSAILGALVISIASTLINWLVGRRA